MQHYVQQTTEDDRFNVLVKVVATKATAEAVDEMRARMDRLENATRKLVNFLEFCIGNHEMRRLLDEATYEGIIGYHRGAPKTDKKTRASRLKSTQGVAIGANEKGRSPSPAEGGTPALAAVLPGVETNSPSSRTEILGS